MESISALLNLFVQRVLLSEFFMWLIGYILGYVFIYPHITFLNQFTPAYIPNWFGVADGVVLLLSVFFLLLYQKLMFCFKRYWKGFSADFAIKHKLKKLNKTDWEVLHQIAIKGYIPEATYKKYLFNVERLTNEKIIKFVPAFSCLSLDTYSADECHYHYEIIAPYRSMVFTTLEKQFS